MGKLLYSSTAMEIRFDDRALAHLQLVIGAKLRRGEKFFFSWREDDTSGSGRSSIWLEPSIPLYFKFSGSRSVEINRAWIDALVHSSHSSSGLAFMPEPGAGAPATNLPQTRV
jgi:hypothetical protein